MRGRDVTESDGSSAGCPPIERLAAFVDGADDGLAAEHITHCPSCQQQLAQIRECDAFLARHQGALTAALDSHSPSAPAIPGYRMVARIELGGQGVVYKAVQTATHRKVAIKMLRDGLLANERQRFRFERETELLASLRHPNIVTLFDRGRTPEGHDYIVMEWVHGVPLDAYGRDKLNPGLAPGVARVRAQLTVFSKIANAIQHAHGGSVIHRDLKPGNILVDDAGEPHIIDFGLARPELGGRGPMPTMTEDFAGTRAYASPEQVAGKADQMRVTTDVYSLGVILYELLTGTFPYPIEGSPSEIDRHIQFTEPPSPRAANRDIPDDVATIVLVALRKEPGQRYPTAGALAADIDDYLAGRPISAKKDSTWYVIRRTVRRHRRTLATVTAGAFALVLGIVGVAAYEVVSARAAAETARAVAESERAEALSLVLQAAGPPRAPSGRPEDYASRGLQRLAERIRLGWLGDKRGLEAATASLVAAASRDGGGPAFAEELVRQTAVQWLLKLGPDHPETAHSLYDLAEVLLVRRHLTEAAQYCERALAIELRVHRERSLDVARGRELLARIHLEQGDSGSAAKLATDAAAIQIALLGEESTEVARSLDTRSAALLAGGDAVAAEDECLRALRVRLTLLGDERPAVAQSLIRLAGILEHHSGDARGHVLADVFGGTTYSDIAAGLRRLAADLAQLDRPTGATPPPPSAVLRRTLALKEAVLGPDHKGLLSTLAALKVEAEDRGAYAEDELALAKAVPIIEKNLGSQSLALANGLEDHARALVALDRYAAAIPALERSVTIWWSLPADRRDDVQAAVNERALASYMELDGRYEQAEARYRHCIEVLLRMRGPEDRTVALARSGRAWVLMHLGRADEAEREARESLAVSQRLEPSVPDRSLQYSLGGILAARGKLDEAEQLLNSAWEGSQDLRGQDGIKSRPPADRIRRRLVEDMISLYATRGDAASEARWRQELPADGQ
jgi:tetratricopeptide (TPR) repeat protein/tRNA A-37 threonylcarbamoyl transferase component Bud32